MVEVHFILYSQSELDGLSVLARLGSASRREVGWARLVGKVKVATCPPETGPNTSRLFSPPEFRNFLPAEWTKAATAARPQVLKSTPTLATKN